MKAWTASLSIALITSGLVHTASAKELLLPANYGAQIAMSSSPTKNSVEVDPWWKHAVVYEIYPRSFADANNTGTGNLNGITAKLDYLKDLGVDAIWITPCYPSPQVDFGYDISDYCNIAPEYGTLKDFDNLIAEAKKRNIKVIMDLVMNHTSDKHPWFVESSSSKDNPKRDWYIWRDGKDGKPPNNWQSVFGHSAWTFDQKTKQYYYHFFYAEQPDLNWRNPAVRKAMYDVARFWLDRGVAGFRLDAIHTLFEAPNLKDNPASETQKNAYGDPVMEHENNYRLPETHDVLKELRAIVDTYPDHPVLIGETSAKNLEQLAAMYGKNDDEIQLPMNFLFTEINKLSAPEFRKQIADADANPVHGWPVYLFSNHDQKRHYVRYGNGTDNDRIAKLTATLLLTLRGTPILYYGEEIGMQNKDPERIEDVKDPIGRVGWPREKGRDGERTPMQWTAGANAGFSTAQPWLPVADNYQTHNVESEKQDPNSIYNFYKSLIHLRRTNVALRDGKHEFLPNDGSNTIAYLRKAEGKAVIVVLNMSGNEQTVHVTLPKDSQSTPKATALLSTDSKQGEACLISDLKLKPFGVFIGEVQE